jgi:hypothetical protein
MVIAMLIGVLFGGTAHLQSDYCHCYRDNFKGELCKSIKGEGLQGSCQK